MLFSFGTVVKYNAGWVGERSLPPKFLVCITPMCIY